MTDGMGRRRRDDDAFGRAVRYVLAVVAVAGLCAVTASAWAGRREACAGAEVTLCDTAAVLAVVLLPAVVLLLGGIGAFVLTYRVWRSGGPWPVWQGTGWFLFVLMTVYLAIGGAVGG